MAVAKLLGHGRDAVTKFYPASLKEAVSHVTNKSLVRICRIVQFIHMEQGELEWTTPGLL